MANEKKDFEYEFGEIGNTGLKVSGVNGIIQINEEWHRKLQGAKGALFYRQMQDNCPIIGAFLLQFNNLIKQTEFTVVASGDTAAHHLEKEFIESALFDDMSITWQDFLDEILSYLVYGWSYFETVYKMRLGDHDESSKRSKFHDGRIGWKKFAIRGQESLDGWKFDEEGGLDGASFTGSNYQTAFIPIEKSLLFRTKSNKNNPEGYSYLRNAFTSWIKKEFIVDLESIACENDATGLPVIKTPPAIMSPDANSKQKQIRQQLEKMVQQIRRGERQGLVFPNETDEDGNATGYNLELLSSGGKTQMDFNQTITRLENRMLTSVLSQFNLLGSDSGKGSYALASSQTKMASLVIGALIDGITDTFNRYAIPRLETLNNVPSELWPELKHGDIEQTGIIELGNYVKQLTDSSIISPDDQLEEYMREYAGLPQANEGCGDVPGAATKPTIPAADGEVVDPNLPLTDDEIIEEAQQETIKEGGLNGAQITAFLQVIDAVNSGLMTKKSAIEFISSSLPIPRDTVIRIIES